MYLLSDVFGFTHEWRNQNQIYWKLGQKLGIKHPSVVLIFSDIIFKIDNTADHFNELNVDVSAILHFFRILDWTLCYETVSCSHLQLGYSAGVFQSLELAGLVVLGVGDLTRASCIPAIFFGKSI